MTASFLSSDVIRTMFSSAMSDMYRAEVPQYGTLMELVAEINDATLAADPGLRQSLLRADELERLSLERHGAIRVGTPGELATIGRAFAVMGMYPVGYYDLAVAGIPVHSTAFRPIDDAALRRNPFRVFTSLLRLELIEDEQLRAEAAGILASRRIFTPGALAMIEKAEQQAGLSPADAAVFVSEVLETFRWHGQATVSADTYKRLHDAHRLIADVVSFKGPHINHLTPRTLDIDAVQAAMPGRGISPKAVIEGPPRRRCAVLLRQTSFKALDEPIAFSGGDGLQTGSHTARFGEIEQRGVALKPKGRKLYDDLLASVRDQVQVSAAGSGAGDYASELATRFAPLLDDWEALRKSGLAFFRYWATDKGKAARGKGLPAALDDLVAGGFIACDPIIYEDFLPVSAAGIFQSNLGTDVQQNYAARANRVAFEAALGMAVADEFALYQQAEDASVTAALGDLGLQPSHSRVA
jgi:uncharacterized glyoxalase superfamily metalloenzyme YdcJ